MNTFKRIVKLAVAVEYTDCISVDVWDSPNKCSGYDTKQSDDEASLTQELWGMSSIPLSPLLPSPLCLGVVAPERVLSMG